MNIITKHLVFLKFTWDYKCMGDFLRFNSCSVYGHCVPTLELLEPFVNKEQLILVLAEGFMYTITMYLFFPIERRKRYYYQAFYHIFFRPQRPGGTFKAIHFTSLIHLTIDIFFKIQNVRNWPWVFQEKFKMLNCAC